MSNTDYFHDETGATCRKNGKGMEVCIADFHAEVIKNVIFEDIAGKELYQEFEVEFYTDCLVATAVVRSNELDKFDYTRINSRLQLSPTVKTAQQEIAYLIRRKASNAPTEKTILFDRLGWHVGNDGKRFYCAGDTIISSDISKQFQIATNISEKYHFKIDDSLPEKEAVNGALVHAEIDTPYSAFVFAAGLLGVMRSLILDADIKPPSVIYLVGPTQSRKTSLSRLCCSLYNRDQLQSQGECGISRVSSTAFRTEELIDEFKDSTYIVDDLFRDPDKKKRSEYERNVRSIIRNFADNSSRQTARSSFQNNCQILITAEYLLDSKTDIGRCFVIHIEHAINSIKLKTCQDEPMVLSTAYYYFIHWLCIHYTEIVADLKNRFQCLRAETPNHEFDYERHYEQAFLMEYAFEIFCKYSVEIKAISPEVADQSKQIFRSNLDDGISFQNDIMAVVDKKEQQHRNFSNELLRMIHSGAVRFGKKGSACFYKGDYIYITCEHFCQKLYEKYRKTFTAKEVAKYFADRYICKKDGSKNVVKYGEKGRRYLALNIQGVEEDANSPAAKIENLFY